MKLKEIINKIDQEELLNEVKNLISIPSHLNTPGQEKEISDFVFSRCSSLGLDTVLQDIGNGRSNVISKVNRTQKIGGSSLVLNGHLDTVPPGENMTSPYEPKIKEDRLYGRGAADMKGAVGCMIYALNLLKRYKIKLKGDLYFTGIVGEETGGTGTRHLINEGFDVDYVIVGEPTDLNLCISHKGAHLLEITIKGKSAHASMPEKGVNAILAMSEFIMKTKEKLVPELNKRIQDMVGSPTLSFGLIRGGKKVNMVADTCTVEIDRRWINNESIPQIVLEFKEILEEVCKDDPVLEYKIISTLPPDGYFGPFIIPGDHEFVSRLKKILMDQGFDSNITGMQGWTDGATTMHSGIPTIVFGPGSMDQAHTDTEWIETAQLTQAVKCYLAFIKEICGWDE